MPRKVISPSKQIDYMCMYCCKVQYEMWLYRNLWFCSRTCYRKLKGEKK